MNDKALAGALETAEQLAELQAQKAELTKKLADSLALAQFAGLDIFEHGRVRSYVAGNARRPEEARLVLELGNGESRQFPLAEVPIRFWQSFAAEIEASRPDNYKGRAFVRNARNAV